jgi:hypothetical protein
VRDDVRYKEKEIKKNFFEGHVDVSLEAIK